MNVRCLCSKNGRQQGETIRNVHGPVRAAAALIMNQRIRIGFKPKIPEYDFSRPATSAPAKKAEADIFAGFRFGGAIPVGGEEEVAELDQDY